MLYLTHLERSVLDAIAEKYRSSFPAVAERLGPVTVLDRENTGHGFYTKFRSSAGTPDLSWPSPIPGPDVRMIGMGDDASMGFLVWVSLDGENTVEGFQYGDAAGGTVDLKSWNLADLRFSEIEWAKEKP